jgi:hypothetical protein
MTVKNRAELFPDGYVHSLEDGLGLFNDDAPELFVLLAESKGDADRLGVVR